MFGLGAPELVIILVILVFVFGLGKLPTAARQLGQGVKSFQDGLQGNDSDDEGDGIEVKSNTNQDRIEDTRVEQAAREATVAPQQKPTET